MAEREAYACSREENDGSGGEDKEAGEEGGDTGGSVPAEGCHASTRASICSSLSRKA